jgi:hypothetical protein
MLLVHGYSPQALQLLQPHSITNLTRGEEK